MLWEALEAKWGTPGPWEAHTEARAIDLNQKVLGKSLHWGYFHILAIADDATVSIAGAHIFSNHCF